MGVVEPRHVHLHSVQWDPPVSWNTHLPREERRLGLVDRRTNRVHVLVGEQTGQCVLGVQVEATVTERGRNGWLHPAGWQSGELCADKVRFGQVER